VARPHLEVVHPDLPTPRRAAPERVGVQEAADQTSVA
jgi:hypothetical protein